jgi:hypothetical protein
MAAILNRIMPFVSDLGRYALQQFAANLPALLTMGAPAVLAAINALPVPEWAKRLIRGGVAVLFGVLAHNAGSPAKISESAVQRALAGASTEGPVRHAPATG